MNINSNKPLENQGVSVNTQSTQGTQKAHGVEAKDAVAQAKKVDLTDTVKLSAQSKEIAGIMAAVNQLPEVRDRKVHEIKQRVDSGTYTIDSRKIAEKMLKEQ
jgi:flagellar biosynthesis anti-sigma factor FlgM